MRILGRGFFNRGLRGFHWFFFWGPDDGTVGPRFANALELSPGIFAPKACKHFASRVFASIRGSSHLRHASTSLRGVWGFGEKIGFFGKKGG